MRGEIHERTGDSIKPMALGQIGAIRLADHDARWADADAASERRWPIDDRTVSDQEIEHARTYSGNTIKLSALECHPK
jgi:hypothetical protein